MAKARTIVNVIATETPAMAPTASAGADRTVRQNATVTLSGSKSEDSDGRIISHHWEQVIGPPVVLLNPLAVTTSFTAPAIASGRLSLGFRLTVTDNDRMKAQDMCTITVTPTGKASDEMEDPPETEG